jgi:tRNA(fMet)-specific endonuclease VapC
MINLDTDHLTILGYPEDPRCAAVAGRMRLVGEHGFGTTIVNVEERMRGWLAEINRRREVHQQIAAYERLVNLLSFLRRWTILLFDDRAADQFIQIRKQRIKIATQDLKIASIALVQNALLLSANLRDFRRVPGLRVESWLE